MQLKQWDNYWKGYSKKSQKHLLFFVVVVALVAVFAIYYTYNPVPQQTPPTERELITPPLPVTPEERPLIEPPLAPSSKGDLIIAMKDERQKLSQAGLGEAEELFVTIKSVQIINKTNLTENKSVIDPNWITIFEGEKTFDLLQFTDNHALIGMKEIEPGNYTQTRFYISGPSIKIDNPDFDIYDKVYPMYMHSNVMKVVRPFSVEKDKTTVLVFDFDVPELVSRTSQGYTFGPVFADIKDEITVKEQILGNGERPENLVEV